MSNFNSELVETNVETISQSSIFNEDLAPVSIAKRTWGIYNIAALWIGMSVCIPTYMLAIGLPPTMALFAFIGVAVTSATVIIFGEAIWDPVVLLSKFKSPIIIIIALIALLVATLTTNIAANVVSPSNDFSNMFPKKISFLKGGMITAVLGIVIMPWKLLSDYSAYIFGWLVGYSGFLGPVAGILICDYYLIKKQRLNVTDLYMHKGDYTYKNGINYRAIIALISGIIVAMIGLVAPPVKFLYDYAWFVGFGVSFVVYYLIMKKK